MDVKKQSEELVKEFDNRKIINVLVVKGEYYRKFYALDLPALLCGHIEMIYTIFSIDKLTDNLGYELGDDSVVQINVVNSSQGLYEYVLKGHSQNISTQVRVTAANNPKYQYLIQVQLPSSPVDISFDKLFNNEMFSDVTLRVADRSISAHKVVLGNKSPVFQAMFTREFHESHFIQVEIKDFSYDTMYDLLSYIYKSKLNDDGQLDEFDRYSNLLKADGIYFVDGLKDICEKKISMILTIDNVLDSLVLAASYNAVYLEKRAIEYIVANVQDILQRPSYKNFAMLYPDILLKISRELD